MLWSTDSCAQGYEFPNEFIWSRRIRLGICKDLIKVLSFPPHQKNFKIYKRDKTNVNNDLLNT